MNSDLNSAAFVSINSVAVMIDSVSEFSNSSVSISVNLNFEILDSVGFKFFKSDSASAVSECFISAYADFDKSVSAVTLSNYVLFYTVHSGSISDNVLLS